MLLVVAALTVGGASGPSSARWRLEGTGRGTPAVSGGRVYFLTTEHEVVAATRGGTEVWRQSTGEPGAETLGSLVLAAGSRIVAGDRAIVGFDAATGERCWRFSGEGDEAPGTYLGDEAEGVVFAGSRSGRLHAVEASSGRWRWSLRASEAAKTTVFQPVVAGRVVVAGYTTFAAQQAGGVVAVDRDSGRVRWDRRFGSESGGFGGGPVVAGEVVIVARGDGVIEGVSRETGERVWELPRVTRADGRGQERDWRALAVSGGTLIAGSLSGVVTAFDLAARRESWRFSLSDGGGSVSLRIAVDGETVYVPHLSGQLVALSARDGRQRWVMGGLSDGFSWAPAIVGGVAYVAARAGLFAVPR